MGLGQQQADSTVFKQIGQTLSRVFRVQRHIGAPGLENRQQPDDQFQRAFAGHPDTHFRPHPCVAQTPGQTVGALIQRAVAQVLISKYQRTGIGGGGRLRFDVLLHARGAGIAVFGGIELIKGGFNLGRRQHRQLANRALGIGHNGRQQVAPMGRHLLDTRCVKQVGGVGQAGHQALAFLMGVQLQIELSGTALPLHAFDLQPGQHPAQRTGSALLVVEHHLKQRAVAQAALAL